MEVIAKINQNIINPLIYLLFALALVFFLWGVAQFILNSGGGDTKNEGKSHIFWGIIGMFIMVGVYGIMNIISGTIDSLMK
jgi:phosphotransferase system  glucose/maltose/N-acetylglucosamine-specific IIC component